MRSCFKSDQDFFRWGLIGMSHFSWVSSGSFIFVESWVGSDQSQPWSPDTSKQKRFVLYYCVGAGGGETGREVGGDGGPPEEGALQPALQVYASYMATLGIIVRFWIWFWIRSLILDPSTRTQNPKKNLYPRFFFFNIYLNL